MLRVQREPLVGQRGLKMRVLVGERPLSFADVLAGWQSDGAFRVFFLGELTAVASTAFFWEMPSVTRATIHQPYEYVIVDSPYLAGVVADRRPFTAQLQAASEPVVSFRNLGGDALLVVPRPLEPGVDYAHLAAFLQNAPLSQQEALLQKMAAVVLAEVGERPLWISTSGLGVYWLHVRLDSRPKYYTYAPYKQG